MPAALMIGQRFSILAPSVSGVCWSRGGISYPRSASRKRIARVITMAALSLAITVFWGCRYPQAYLGAGGMADE
jgi:hypothetical protein